MRALKKSIPSILTLFTFAAVFCSPAIGRAQDRPPVSAQKAKWQSTASAGLTLTRGNSETFLATMAASTTRKWEQNVLNLQADAAYGRNKDQTTGQTTKSADMYHGYIQYDRIFGNRFYAYGRVEGLYDDIAGIKYRFILSPGGGYYLVRTKNTDLSVEVGPGYVFQQLGDDRSSFVTMRAGEKFHHNLSDRARIWEMAEWLPKVQMFNNYIVNAELGVAADLTSGKKLSLSCVLQDTYNSVPAAGRKNNDMKLVTSLNYKF